MIRVPRAVGKSLKTWVNDVPTADLVDEKSGKSCGFIGLQVHGIAKGTGPYEVRWRNIYLKDLTRGKLKSRKVEKSKSRRVEESKSRTCRTCRKAEVRNSLAQNLWAEGTATCITRI